VVCEVGLSNGSRPVARCRDLLCHRGAEQPSIRLVARRERVRAAFANSHGRLVIAYTRLAPRLSLGPNTIAPTAAAIPPAPPSHT